VVVLRIDRHGSWRREDPDAFLARTLLADERGAVPTGGAELPFGSNDQPLSVPARPSISAPAALQKLDVVFPVLHGPYGEDGSVQGLLKTAGIPFAGPGVLAAAVGLDKDVMKRLLVGAGIPVADFRVVHAADPRPAWDAIAGVLGAPVFVKPANLGSSVGIRKVSAAGAFGDAVEQAFAYDTKIIIERAVAGREIECAVLGNDDPIVSVPGEVIPHHEFYSYEAKYLDEDGAELVIPAALEPSVTERARELALAAFRALCCDGMARVDFFLQSDSTLLVNELNTIPGFTRISMYPKLWDASGIPYAELIERLLKLGIERYERERGLRCD
jgi:D-alanine-D-alanine ligase